MAPTDSCLLARTLLRETIRDWEVLKESDGLFQISWRTSALSAHGFAPIRPDYVSPETHILAAEASFGLHMKKKNMDHSVAEILEEIPRAVIPALSLSCLL